MRLRKTFKLIRQLTGLQTYRPIDLQIYRLTDLQTYKPTVLQGNLQTYKVIYRPTVLQGNLQLTDLQTYRPTNLQTYRPTDLQIRTRLRKPPVRTVTWSVCHHHHFNQKNHDAPGFSHTMLPLDGPFRNDQNYVDGMLAMRAFGQNNLNMQSFLNFNPIVTIFS